MTYNEITLKKIDRLFLIYMLSIYLPSSTSYSYSNNSSSSLTWSSSFSEWEVVHEPCVFSRLCSLITTKHDSERGRRFPSNPALSIWVMLWTAVFCCHTVHICCVCKRLMQRGAVCVFSWAYLTQILHVFVGAS